MPFPELRSCALIPFCQAVFITWAFSPSSLLTHAAGHFPLPNCDDGERAVDPWRLATRARTPVAAAAALYRGREASTTGDTVGKTAWLRLVW